MLALLQHLNMAKVHVEDVKVLNNPGPFFSPFQFEIVFECIDEIPEGERWQLFVICYWFSPEMYERLTIFYN